MTLRKVKFLISKDDGSFVFEERLIEVKIQITNQKWIDNLITLMENDEIKSEAKSSSE